MTGKTYLVLAAVLSLCSALIMVSADSYSLYCLGEQQHLDFGALCNPAIPARTGPIIVCVHNLDNGKICPAPINACNNLGLHCTQNTNTSIDSQGPLITLTSPHEGDIFNSRSVPLFITLNEKADISYLDTNDPRASWKSICSSCTSYNRVRSFAEGLNDVIIRAVDESDNPSYYNISFYIDSKKPRILSTEPKRGFASGTFMVQFQESNPIQLRLHYGSVSMQQTSLDLSSCTSAQNKQTCEISVPLASFEGQEIQYFFSLTDIANTTVSSRPIKLKVDTIAPLLTSLNTTLKGPGRVEFVLTINEPNFDEAEYIDWSDPRPSYKPLCTSLRNGICKKQVTLRPAFGTHSIDIQIVDDAGNAAAHHVDLTL